ncbi:MAG: 50S ribosomal protein L4 [Firmicutes bacterium]|nr:50S ribosomal protein L4 [Candidatus Colimorpha enterica]
MPNVKVLNMQGAEVGEMNLADSVFAVEVNATVLHTAVRAYLMNQRQGTQSALTRTEVSGGGIKPWRQKGTGRARQGSTRSPQWTHGGIVFAPKPRDYRVTINKKTRQLAIKSALSAKVAENELIVIDAITAENYKTKVMVDMLAAVKAKKKALVVLAENDNKVVKSLANIEGVKAVQANSVNVYDVLNADTLVIAKAAAEKLQEVYA